MLGHLLDLYFGRLYTNERLSGPPFICPACRSKFRPRFFLPLVGYCAALGKCPDCGKPLPTRALIMPLGGAALLATSSLVFDSLVAGLLGGLFATIFLTPTLTDIDRRLLPNRLVYPAMLLAIGLFWGWPDSSVVQILAGGLVAITVSAVLMILSIPFGGARARLAWATSK